MLTFLNKTNDKEKNIELVSLIDSGLKDLKEEIKKMFRKEKEIEYPESIVKLLKIFLSLINKINKDRA